MTSQSKLFDSIRIGPKKKAKAKAKPQTPECQWDGCEKPGGHRAPVGREREGEYFHFCVDHVRQYNKGYNYFSGLSDGDIAQYQKDALTGHRPTWKVGANGDSIPVANMRPGTAGYHNRLNDPMGVMGGSGKGNPSAPTRRLKPLEKKALQTLGLKPNSSSDDIKTRYKELVKQHHPDANGGDRGSEERFRDVIQAYRLLKQSNFC